MNALVCVGLFSLIWAGYAYRRGHNPWPHLLAPVLGVPGLLHSWFLLQTPRLSAQEWARERFLRRFGDHLGMSSRFSAEELATQQLKDNRTDQDFSLTVAVGALGVLVMWSRAALWGGELELVHLGWAYVVGLLAARGFRLSLSALKVRGPLAGTAFLCGVLMAACCLAWLPWQCRGCCGNIGG